MAYDEQLAERIRAVLARESGLSEKRMFGGLAFLLDGHLTVSAGSGGSVLLRVDPARTELLVREPHVTRYEMRGREMDGWLHVSPDAVPDEAALRRWVGEGVAYVRTLGPK